MAKLSMKRIEIAAPLRERKKIMEALQRRGVVELADCAGDGLRKPETADSAAQFEKARDAARAALAVLAEYAPPRRKSLFAGFSGLRAMEPQAFDEQALLAEQLLKKCVRVNSLQAEIAEARAGIARLHAQADRLRAWEALDVPLDCRGTEYAAALIGSVPHLCTAEDILDKLGVPAEAEVVSASPEQSNLFVLCHRDDESAVAAALRELGFARADETIHLPPAAQLAQYAGEIAALEGEIARAAAEIQGFAGMEGDIEFLIDYYEARRQKYEALGSLALTDNVFVLRGYIPEKYAAQVTAELERDYTVALTLAEPGEDEDVPVLLENNAFAAPVEAVTEMYALPSKEDIDPNPVMAFFYYFFFGMMLSDAGYGLLMVIGCAVALRKLQLSKKMRKNLTMFLYCGISTVFWGAMFGSWFGDIVKVIFTQFLGRPAPDLAIWMDPVANPMKLLLVCFALGIAHLFAGVAANAANQWRAGRKFDALCDSVPVYLMVLGAAPLAGGMLTSVPPILSSIGKWAALAGVVLIVLTAGRGGKGILGKLGGGLGLNGLYGIAAGYLGDIMSYSRLLALGLCTGVIAGVVNMMGTMPQNLVAKGIALAVVFVLGHSLNMAINVLGAYVHANRLQFVEMFGKFYTGGGRAFRPFHMETKYITLKEDLLND
ncbi:MAG: V-type ATP synthase subunit I [Oscillospiraceae bacterium]|nr:V-type ATP synthase subunit I [Oscillospiraceae bacterium]